METNLHFTQYEFWSKGQSEVYNLLKIINNNHGWAPKRAPAQFLWSKFDLPFIGVSDQDLEMEGVIEPWSRGYLGNYGSIWDGDYKFEERIILYRKSIDCYANLCSRELHLDNTESFITITKIVKLHAVGSWIFHTVPTEDTDRNYLDKYFERDLQIAIAQFFVVLGIGDDELLNKVFNWMCSKEGDLFQNKLPGGLESLAVLRDCIQDNYYKCLYEALAVMKDKDEKPTFNNLHSIIYELVNKQVPRNLSQYADFVAKNSKVVLEKVHV